MRTLLNPERKNSSVLLSNTQESASNQKRYFYGIQVGGDTRRVSQIDQRQQGNVVPDVSGLMYSLFQFLSICKSATQ